MNPQYLTSEIERALAQDPRTHELGVQVEIEGNVLVVRGEVGSERRRRLVEDVIADLAPGMPTRSEVTVTTVDHPGPVEENP